MSLDPAVRALLVARELSLPLPGVTATLALLDGGATVPFIARYRKEATGALDDLAIQRISDHAEVVDSREARRAMVLETIRGQGVLTAALEAKIRAATTLSEIEDLYLPFKPRRRTRAQVRGRAPGAPRLGRRVPRGNRSGLSSSWVPRSKKQGKSESVWKEGAKVA